MFLFVPKSWFNRLIELYKRCRLITLLISLTTVLAAFAFAVPQLALSDEPLNAAADSTSDSRSDTNAPAPEAPANPDAAEAEETTEDTKNTETDEDASSDEHVESTDTADILYAIRNSYAEKDNKDKQIDDLIRSQSNSYVFLKRNKPQDSPNNLLDNWLLSSFEDNMNLTLIEFGFVNIPAVNVNLDSDIVHLLAIIGVENSLLNYTGYDLVMNRYINFRIPESVMKYIDENIGEIVDVTRAPAPPIKTSTIDYLVLALAILGLSILGYVIYRIVVYLFLLDQRNSFEVREPADRDIVTPISMETFSECLFSAGYEDTKK
ncbi:MAG: hypothetical protein IKX40_10285 [Thermoguttaceae bacterium]|nr:hypothetical protein [Thermoguttaceae bacterium]